MVTKMRNSVSKAIKHLPSAVRPFLSPKVLFRKWKVHLPSWTMLVVVCMITGLILGSVYELLKDQIDAHSALSPELLSHVFPAADAFEQISNPPGYDVGTCYAAFKDSQVQGYVVSVSEQGRNGKIQVQVGVDLSGQIIGTYIDPSKHRETPDIGGDAIESETFQAQFLGGHDPFVIGENVDAVTFATISSSAVIRAVNRALAAAQSLLTQSE